jgi:hypothetical protein
VAGLDELLPFGDWRDKFLQAQTSDARKFILTNAFTDCLFKLGQYKHICETTILRPSKDRPLYSLFYGTRHDTGLEVFRDCQVKALEAQSKTRAATKVRVTETKTGQSELFRSLHEMSPEEDVTPFLEAELQRAQETMIALAPPRVSPMLYKDFWPLVLSRHVVRKPDVNKIAADLKKAGTLVFPNWEAGKRVPHPEYTFYRASAAEK